MLFKSFPVAVKATGEADGLAEGQFEALVSVFGNVDSYGDVVVKGAFADTLKQWEASGAPIPVYYAHRMDDPDYNIGHVLEAKETEEGLWVRAELDLESDTSKARQVYRLLKGSRLRQFSFAYDVDEGGYVKQDGDDIFELRRLTVHEVSATPIGANRETELLGVKAHDLLAKAGRVLSAKNETALREALTSLEESTSQIKTVLAALEPADDTENDGKAKHVADAKNEEPDRAKFEEQTRRCPADLSVLRSIELAALSGD